MLSSARRVLYWSGVAEVVVGAVLFGVTLASFVWPCRVLHVIIGPVGSNPSLDRASFDCNSWAQTAIAFGMHAYADLASGLEMISIGNQKQGGVPATVSLWNSTLFCIRFLWAVAFVSGFIDMQLKPSIWCISFVALLVFDSVVIRPAAVWAARVINDANPPKKDAELSQWQSFSTGQKFCRGVFFYESIISGCSGAVYALVPRLFLGLYFNRSAQSPLAAWCLSMFGINVMAFGLYQMNANIDERIGHVTWWLILDFVWMYLFWEGVTNVHGPWNPLLLTGANFWCHAAFHADSTLAIARIMWLAFSSNLTMLSRISVTVSIGGAAKEIAPATSSRSRSRSSSKKRR